MSFQQAQADVTQTTTEDMPWYDGRKPLYLWPWHTRLVVQATLTHAWGSQFPWCQHEVPQVAELFMAHMTVPTNLLDIHDG